MFIGILRLEIFIRESNSLKHKRQILNSLKKRLRNNFNVSVCCFDYRDKWQRCLMAAVNVTETKKDADRICSYIKNFMEKENSLDILDYTTEII